MDTESFIIYIRSEYFYKDIANYVEKWYKPAFKRLICKKKR